MVEVSVILPNYNHENYLKERIDSILQQTYQDFELIILDDHSSDNSQQIIELYRSNAKVSRIEYNSSNSGSPFKQWAKGIQLANGSFIWIAESDDSCDLSFLEKTVKKMREYPSVGIVFSQSMEFEVESGKSYSSFTDHSRFSQSFNHSYFNAGRREIRDKLVYENTIPNASAVIFRKDVYFRTGGVSENMKLYGDWFLWVKMLLISDIYFIEEPMNKFRLTPNSARVKYSKLNTFHERMEILSFLSKKHISGAFSAEVRLLKTLFNHYEINRFSKPWETAMAEGKNIKNPHLKIFYAVFLSFIDRVFNRIQRPKKLQRT
ncbi:MAG TPA: glycosyltransferase family 2 protein [Aquella sp.]|nr:glycosyltransferase family 2 protein [Aquella sp.]